MPRAPPTHPLRQVAASPFARCSYTEAVEKLEEAVKGGRKFENAVRRQGAEGAGCELVHPWGLLVVYEICRATAG